MQARDVLRISDKVSDAGWVMPKKLAQYRRRAIAIALGLFSLYLRSTTPEVIKETKEEAEREETDFSRIRCPLCKWHPDESSRWCCADCDHPEYFRDGCWTQWNTFTTRGLCPGCHHQWRWTACLACWGWSPHEEWYLEKHE